MVSMLRMRSCMGSFIGAEGLHEKLGDYAIALVANKTEHEDHIDVHVVLNYPVAQADDCIPFLKSGSSQPAELSQ